MPGFQGPGYLAVIGPDADASAENLADSREVGRRIALAGRILLTGGLGGVMAAASEGAHDEGGLTVGLLPGSTRQEGNHFLTVALPTGLGELRNGLIVRCADAVICVGGSWGTLSEIGFAVRTGVPVVALDGGWSLPAGLHLAPSPAAAVDLALALAAASLVQAAGLP